VHPLADCFYLFFLNKNLCLCQPNGDALLYAFIVFFMHILTFNGALIEAFQLRNSVRHC